MSMQRLLIIAFWSAALFALVMASLPKPPRLPGDPGDKIQHIMAFLTLAALAAAAYPRVRLIKLAIGLSAFGALIEIIQLIPALNRDAEWVDWLADTLAACLVLLIVHLFRSRRRVSS
jgi:VanZ family protein